MNTLFDREILGHHSMRDHLLSIISDADLTGGPPGANPPLGELLLEMGRVQGVYTHSFEASVLDWAHIQTPQPSVITIDALRAWFGEQDRDMKAELDRLTEEDLHVERVDRGDGSMASPYVQHEIYREAIYIFYGKLSVYLRVLERDPGRVWAAWID